MPAIERLETIIHEHGYEDFKWFDPQKVVVAQWVRMKCEYGCPSYGRNASCPPNTPSVEACQRFFAEYSTGIVLHFQKVAPEKPDRRAWSARPMSNWPSWTRDIFLAGYPKAFLLFMNWSDCSECVPERKACKEPRLFAAFTGGHGDGCVLDRPRHGLPDRSAYRPGGHDEPLCFSDDRMRCKSSCAAVSIC